MSKARVAKKTTALDKTCLAEVRRCGLVGVDADGEFWLQGCKQFGPGRFRRLIDLGLVKASGDSLFADAAPQSYRPTEV